MQLQMLADASGCNSGAFELPLITEPFTKQQALQAAPAAQEAPPPAGEVDVMADSRAGYQDPLQRLLAGEVRCVEYCGDEVVVDAPRRRRVYLPGSFNPLHEGEGWPRRYTCAQLAPPRSLLWSNQLVRLACCSSCTLPWLLGLDPLPTSISDRSKAARSRKLLPDAYCPVISLPPCLPACLARLQVTGSCLLPVSRRLGATWRAALR